MSLPPDPTVRAKDVPALHPSVLGVDTGERAKDRRLASSA